MSLIVDPEFESLIPPLTEEEFKQLEENCVRDGIREPLVIWPQNKGYDCILIDGHNRFKIIAKHMLHYNTRYIQFKDRDEAKAWIIMNQLGRRNLSAYDRSILALKLKPVIAEKAKETQGSRNDICQKSDKSIDTKKELAKIAGVSHDTIHKVEAIEQKATPEIKKKVQQGELSINQGYLTTVKIKDKSPAQLKKEILEKANDEREDFKNKKTVTIAEAKQDKTNREMLALDLYIQYMRIGAKIYEVKAAEKESSITIEEMARELSGSQVQILLDDIGNWMAELKTIERRLKG